MGNTYKQMEDFNREIKSVKKKKELNKNPTNEKNIKSEMRSAFEMFNSRLDTVEESNMHKIEIPVVEDRGWDRRNI